MQPKPNPTIVAVERLRDGVVVTFADGSCAFFSANLLYSVAPQAKPQDSKAAAW